MFLPRPIDELWPFFASAENLVKITPPWLSFKILTPTPIDMHTGTLIDYRIGLKGIPMRWRSQITVWEPGQRFVDEQLKGPYLKWHHEHTFEAVKGGTLCTDLVHYRVLMGWLMHGLVVKRDLVKIFEYRQQILQEMFGAASPVEPPEAAEQSEAIGTAPTHA